MNLVQILTGAHVALKILQARLLAFLALLATIGLFCWAMWLQTVLGLIIAAAWGALIFLPVLFAGRGGFDGEAEGPQHQPGQDESRVRAADRTREATPQPDDD